MADSIPRIARPAIRWLLPSAALGLLLLANAVFTPGFFDITIANAQLQGSTIDILTRGSTLVIVAIGMTLVIATGGVDLSVGAVVAIAGAAVAVAVNTGLPAAIAIAFALTLAVTAGFFNGILVAGARIQPIVATLILMVAGRGVAQLITHGQTVDFNSAGLAFLDEGTFALIPMPVIVALAMLVATIAITRATALGLFIEAIGDNETASRLAGVRTRLVKLFAYTLCGLGAGVAGILAAADVRAADANNAGIYLELDAILAVVIGATPLIGGRFTLVGTALGALFIQTLTTTLLRHDVNDDATLVVKAIVVIGVCLMLSERFRTPARATLRRLVNREAAP
jgi:simple sugar transport system permease protein